jgi:hypothetical protein
MWCNSVKSIYENYNETIGGISMSYFNLQRRIGVVRWCFLISLFISVNAHAFFFIFIPGSLIRKVGDAMTGAQGENCVGEDKKVGDVIYSPSGNSATIKSLSGTSSICRDPLLPIRAKLELHFTMASTAGIDLPDDLTVVPLKPFQQFQGFLVHATANERKVTIYVNSRKRSTVADQGVLMQSIADNMTRRLEDASTKTPEELDINGMHAWRFELTGRNKGMFGRSYTYLVTMLEGDDEYIIANMSAPTDDYEKEKDGFKKIAATIRGIKKSSGNSPVASAPQSQNDLKPQNTSETGNDPAGTSKALEKQN